MACSRLRGSFGGCQRYTLALCVSATQSWLLCPDRTGWLPPAEQSKGSCPHSVPGQPSRAGEPPAGSCTHAPHSTFRERMLSKPHSMMLGQAEVNSILLPWKFSWSYTVIWNGEQAAELGTACRCAQAVQRLLETEGQAPSREEPAEAAPGPPLRWDTAPHSSARPCTAGPAAPCLGVGGAAGWPPLRSPAHPCGDQFPGQRCRPERGAEPFWDGRVAGLWLTVLPASAPNALGQRGLTGKGRGGTPWGAAADALLSRNSSRLRRVVSCSCMCSSSPSRPPPRPASPELLPDPSGLIPTLFCRVHCPLCSPHACPCPLCQPACTDRKMN